MAKPLSLFIHSPFDAWSTRLNYGDQLPEHLSFWGAVSGFLLLETIKSDIPIFAASGGYISTRSPFDPTDDVQEEMALPTDLVVPEQISFYLIPGTNTDPIYHAKAIGLPRERPLVVRSDLNPLQFLSNPIDAFYYINLDTDSLKAAILSSLPLVGIPGFTLSAISQAEQRWQHFLAGQLDIPVAAGMHLGTAAQAILPGDNAALRQIGFTVFSSLGAHDPAHFYDFMREFVNEETDIDAFLDKVPKRWPLFQAGTNKQEVIDLTAGKIYPYSALEAVKECFEGSDDWNRSDWRTIGDNQKALYRRRLLKRTGRAAPDNVDPPFMFDDLDWQNIFQLEAIVEFYVNYNEPWGTDAPPEPGADGYQVIDFLPLAGSAATRETIGGRLYITLDGEPDFGRIRPGKDLIHLDSDIDAENRLYRITGIDQPNNRLIIDGTPNFTGSIAWNIRHRPTLVIIDSFGHRIQGSHATIGATNNNQTTITLNTSPGQSAALGRYDPPPANKKGGRVNKDRFETIFFPEDTSAVGQDHAHEPRIYRIVSVNAAAHTVTVDGEPNFGGGSSSWHIPAGLGGTLPALYYSLTGNATRGWDHYNGLLFIVHNGAVQRDFPGDFPNQRMRYLKTTRFRWTSYTSRHNTNPQHSSSIRGNQKYLYSSYKSSTGFKNFSFKIVDEDAVLSGSSASIVQPTGSSTMKIQLDERPNLNTIRTGNNSDRLVLHNINNNQNHFDIAAVDKDEHIVTVAGTPQLPAGITSTSWQIKHSNLTTAIYDGVRKNRYYFAETVEEDTSDDDDEPGIIGKKYIRLHYGNRGATGTGSAGCQVSRVYYQMRNYLIHLHQQERIAFGAGRDDDLHEIYQFGNNHSANKNGFDDVDAKDWNEKLIGTMWLIRPDERPIDQ